MARKQCQVCGQPATVRVEANLNGRHSTMLLCDDHYRQLVRQQKRTVSPLEALFGSRSGLFEDFLGSDFFRIGDDATPVAADTDDVVDASFGEPAAAGSGAPRRRGSGLASRISEQSEALLQEAAKHAAEFGRSEVDTEHLLLALADSDVVKTILGQFKIKVDDLKRQIESEAKRGDKPFEGEIGVSPRVKDALSRAFVASNELGHSYVGPEHFLIGLAEEGEGLAANLLRRYGLTPQALRQQVSKVVGTGGVGVDDHPFLNCGLACGNGMPRPVHLDRAQPAAANGFEVRVLAEVRDKDSRIERGVEHGGALDGLDLTPVYGQLHHVPLQWQ